MSRGNSVVLIVSKPGPMRDTLQMALSALPQVETVALTATDRSALQMMAERPPALVVYDADIPGAKVEAVLEAVTNLQGKSLVITDSRELQIKATAAGANVALLKGHRAARVLEIVETLLSHPDEEPEPGRNRDNYD